MTQRLVGNNSREPKGKVKLKQTWYKPQLSVQTENQENSQKT